MLLPQITAVLSKTTTPATNTLQYAIIILFIIRLIYVFIACGINHQTASIQFREKLAVPPSMQQTMLTQLMVSEDIQEVTLLSTCNRTELYCQAKHDQSLKTMLADLCHIPHHSLDQHWYSHTENHAIKHALRVASGLDSMMIGEPQILGQFKQAYLQACEVGTVKSSLKQIFPYIFRASKRIRNLSGIGNSPISVAYAGAQRILQTISNPKDAKIFIIGSGDIAALITKYLSAAGVQQFFISSRTENHAHKLAEQYHAKVIPLTELTPTLKIADIVITASTCPVPFITPAFIKPILEERSKPNLFLLDLALPRNITEETGQLPHVTLCNLDELQTQCQTGKLERQEAAVVAESLVEQELTKFLRWSDAQQAKYLITDYRKQMQVLSKQELSRAMHQLSVGESIQEVLEKLTHRLYKKLTHLPTLSLRQAAAEGCTELLDLAQLLHTKSNYDPNH